MELFVILALNRAPDVSDWQLALRRNSIPAQFTKEMDPDGDGGFVPIVVNGRSSGFYFYKDSVAGLRSTYPALANVSLDGSVAYTLNYGGDFYECAAVFYTAAALVADFDGKAFEPQAGVFMSRQELIDAGNLCVQSAAMPDAH
jgi:hypothetical protein